MSRAEKFIQDYTKNCSNQIINGDYGIVIPHFAPWLTPDQARKAVEIAREEVKSKLLNMLNTSIDNKHFFEQLDDYIEELENKI